MKKALEEAHKIREGELKENEEERNLKEMKRLLNENADLKRRIQALIIGLGASGGTTSLSV